MKPQSFLSFQIPHTHSSHSSHFATHTHTLESLFQTLLHRAFDGSLTAKWREG